MTPERLASLQAFHMQQEYPVNSLLPGRAPEEGALTTIGYTEQDAALHLAQYLAQPRTALIDIRYTPYSRWRPEWNSTALQAVYGLRYTHIKALGNVNYKTPGSPIQLLDPDLSVAKLVQLLRQGISLKLLCACKDYERCHRKVVFTLVMEALVASQGEVHA
ncbi:DUF488 domain-containing protein [Dictyobacter arantiisoli]|uniref:DUF488 domain-containing protein n=1 Tax=Dictyobacter arantiisoli TaxID=2014874 RepID=A0A5A5T7E6_9CHLR|nr:DUF488 domain-containing protein [Dictyobacter arantiisoli]GCF07327.1 hypothetical protein KDI_08910 [Dictyobacter arantiisoli]